MVETTNPSASLAFARKASGATATESGAADLQRGQLPDRPQQPSRPGPDGLRHGRQQVPGRGRPRWVQGGGRRCEGRLARRRRGLQGRHRQPAERSPGHALHGSQGPHLRARADAVRPAGAAAAREGRRRFPRQADRRRAHGERGQHPGRCNRRQQRRRDPRELADRRRPLAVLARPRNRQSRRRRQADRRSAQGSDPELRRGRPADPVDHRLIARPARELPRRRRPLRRGDDPVDPQRRARRARPRTLI